MNVSVCVPIFRQRWLFDNEDHNSHDPTRHRHIIKLSLVFFVLIERHIRSSRSYIPCNSQNNQIRQMNQLTEKITSRLLNNENNHFLQPGTLQEGRSIPGIKPVRRQIRKIIFWSWWHSAESCSSQPHDSAQILTSSIFKNSPSLIIFWQLWCRRTSIWVWVANFFSSFFPPQCQKATAEKGRVFSKKMHRFESGKQSKDTILDQ